MRRTFAAFICFVIAVTLLLWQYPWSVIHGAFTFPVHTTVLAYGVTGLLMTCVAVAAYAIVSRFREGRRSIGTWAFAALVSVAVFVVIALTLGPAGVDVPGTRVSGAFFSEWNFITFVLLAVPYSVAAPAILIAICERKHLA